MKSPPWPRTRARRLLTGSRKARAGVSGAVALLALLSASPAAASDPITVKLASPVAKSTKFIAGEAMFTCEGDTCVALAPMSVTFAVSTCRLIAHRAGAVTAFSDYRTLDARKLADCNAGAHAPATGAATPARP